MVGRKNKKKEALHVGDFVFAKMRGYRAWPARILKPAGRLYLVYFYGTCNTAKVPRAQLFPYKNCCARYAAPHQLKNAAFKEAMRHIQEVLKHPSIDPGFEELLVECEAEYIDEMEELESMSASSEIAAEPDPEPVDSDSHVTADI